MKGRGDTCTIVCYSNWVRHYETNGLAIVLDGEDVPNNLTEQPWYLREFALEDKFH